MIRVSSSKIPYAAEQGIFSPSRDISRLTRCLFEVFLASVSHARQGNPKPIIASLSGASGRQRFGSKA
jgi:hypothetical protein